MSTTEYYRLALLQHIKMQHTLQDIQKDTLEIEQLKQKISLRHKKHRRCDKQILKNNNCPHCQRIYATQVALRLHLKLKHKETISDKILSDSNTVLISESDKENLDGNMEIL